MQLHPGSVDCRGSRHVIAGWPASVQNLDAAADGISATTSQNSPSAGTGTQHLPDEALPKSGAAAVRRQWLRCSHRMRTLLEMRCLGGRLPGFLARGCRRGMLCAALGYGNFS